MGKLNIAHHKSYHPYRRDNIEKVRRDEEEAKLKESVEDGRMMLADSEARIDLLRHRAGLGTAKKSKGEDDGEIPAQPEAGSSSLTTPGGHINLFEDLERAAIPVTSRRAEKAKAVEEDKGVPLAPSEKDRKPWYSESAQNEVDQDRQRRDLARKSAHDPLTSINTQLGARSDNDQEGYGADCEEEERAGR
ncbi:hypothetical protein EUX98_g3667 [Antrodiella citrinella]|uniref:CBF1-interacting co-repressor CIR N-terminal domain-containing protein n=1 Tax=Antrodiella citrinella TaxID=2447956 RepID=A0A4S4N445_9APHY|nr:hypothetical protein EUX98_g3667 [Antrodiella citrinella]